MQAHIYTNASRRRQRNTSLNLLKVQKLIGPSEKDERRVDEQTCAMTCVTRVQSSHRRHIHMHTPVSCRPHTTVLEGKCFTPPSLQHTHTLSTPHTHTYTADSHGERTRRCDVIEQLHEHCIPARVGHRHKRPSVSRRCVRAMQRKRCEWCCLTQRQRRVIRRVCLID
jgi:hypothetical protein